MSTAIDAIMIKTSRISKKNPPHETISMNNTIEKLAEYFTKFPGIGTRQSKRLVYFLLSRDDQFVKTLAELILDVKRSVGQCSGCYRFFPKETRGQQELCKICTDPNVDTSILMVVEKDTDLENIKKMGVYHGLFFVLGGTIPILDKAPKERVRAAELVARINTISATNTSLEVILAISATTEGENTTLYIQKILEPFITKNRLKVSTLGRGLSTGTELEYSDDETLKNALKNRG